VRDTQKITEPSVCLIYVAFSGKFILTPAKLAAGTDAAQKWRANGSKYPLSLSGQSGARQDEQEQSATELP